MKYVTSLILTLLVTTEVAYAQQPPAKELACRACHGLGGTAPIAPNYPKLNGCWKIAKNYSLFQNETETLFGK